MANCGGEARQEGVEGLEKLVVSLGYSCLGYRVGATYIVASNDRIEELDAAN